MGIAISVELINLWHCEIPVFYTRVDSLVWKDITRTLKQKEQTALSKSLPFIRRHKRTKIVIEKEEWTFFFVKQKKSSKEQKT